MTEPRDMKEFADAHIHVGVAGTPEGVPPHITYPSPGRTIQDEGVAVGSAWSDTRRSLNVLARGREREAAGIQAAFEPARFITTRTSGRRSDIRQDAWTAAGRASRAVVAIRYGVGIASL